jgi:hypothetical protein
MTTKEIADFLVDLCRNGKIEEANCIFITQQLLKKAVY